MNKKNKVKFNLRNVHYAPVTFDESDEPHFGTPVAWPGAVSLSMDPNGEVTPFYADGIVYWQSSSNNGYEGDLETAMVPESFLTDILGQELDGNGVMIERSTAQVKNFALLYEVEGDKKARRCVLYNCTCTRPSLSASTTEDTKEPETDSVTITASPIPGSDQVKAQTSAQTNEIVYNGWWNEVYYNKNAVPSVDLSELTIGSITITPEFDPSITVYEGSTTNATNTVTAVAKADGATVKITVNGKEITSGSSATWTSGTNIVCVIVTNGDAAKSYTVTVTKGE